LAQNTLQEVKQGVDTFNATLGFGKSNCAGGDCINAVGMAGTAVLAAVVSGGESEASKAEFVEQQISRSSTKIENIAKNNLTTKTVGAAKREVNGGMSVAKAGGGTFSHEEKVLQAINGLNRQATHLEGLLQRSGLSEQHVNQINDVIERAKGLLSIAREAITKDPI
jgi:hypothetical protein